MLPLELLMNDLNDNEKYAYLDEPLPTNTYSPKHIEAGDIMLFGDDCLVIFYESFDTSYSYSKIGHIDNLPELGDENIDITISAEESVKLQESAEYDFQKVLVGGTRVKISDNGKIELRRSVGDKID
jgi:hypothetical protein